MAQVKKQIRRDARYFLITTVVLLSVGLLFVYSSSSVYALETCGSSAYFLRKQLAYLGIGIFGFLFFALLPLPLFKKGARYFFVASLILTMLTLLGSLKLTVHGSSRWIRVAGMSFQPSEVLKLCLFMYMGVFLEQKEKRLVPLIMTYIPFLCLLGITSIALLWQPDFGSVVTVFSTTLILFFVAHFNMFHLGILVTACLPVGVFLVVSKAYRLRRIFIFLNPWSDPLGKGFQIIQSLIALGVGGMWGLGIGCSRQKFFYLPMQHTDFIFSIIAEETGFVGASLVVLAFILFGFFGIRIVAQLSDPFAIFTSLAFVTLITLQAIINIMVVCALLPTKGLGLPFISYGGSALLTHLSMVGFVINAARSRGG